MWHTSGGPVSGARADFYRSVSGRIYLTGMTLLKKNCVKFHFIN